MYEQQPVSEHGWSESNSATFLDTSELFVPERTEQLDLLLDLVPARSDEAFTLVELASGGGLLAERMLEHFPRCRYLALDGSALMRKRLAERLERFGQRVEILDFEMGESTWRSALPAGIRCVVSSLCVHHLTGEGKQALFRDMAGALEPGGALLLADIVLPISPKVAEIYARQYDEIVKVQSLSLYGDLRGFEQFEAEKWNYFRYDYPDPASFDHPSLLSEQLLWLREAGLSLVDCFWLRAGHAVYGGYKGR